MEAGSTEEMNELRIITMFTHVVIERFSQFLSG